MGGTGTDFISNIGYTWNPFIKNLISSEDLKVPKVGANEVRITSNLDCHNFFHDCLVRNTLNHRKKHPKLRAKSNNLKILVSGYANSLSSPRYANIFSPTDLNQDPTRSQNYETMNQNNNPTKSQIMELSLQPKNNNS